MEHLKNQNGIMLISLTVTIIVLLMLGAIMIVIANDLIIHRAITASTKTVEVALKEKIEMAWMEIKTLEVQHKINFKEELEKVLTESYGFESVKISEISDAELNIVFVYQNEEFNFAVLPNGEIRLNSKEEIKESNLLKGNVKIGDYIEYSIEYTDIYSGENYTSTNGWRVIDDGVMEGTSGYVRIISTGIPVKWHYNSLNYENNQSAVEELMNHFENLTFLDNSIYGTTVKGSDFLDEKIADKVSNLTLTDLNQIYNNLYGTNRELHDISMIKDDEYKLLNLKDYTIFYYCLASINEATNDSIYYMSDIGIEDKANSRLGIRPVIYLKEGLSGKLENNVWKIIN